MVGTRRPIPVLLGIYRESQGLITNPKECCLYYRTTAASVGLGCTAVVGFQRLQSRVTDAEP